MVAGVVASLAAVAAFIVLRWDWSGWWLVGIAGTLLVTRLVLACRSVAGILGRD